MTTLGLAPEAWQAVLLSLQVAALAVVFSLPFGLALGWFLARKHFTGKAVVETLLNLPLVVPPVVTGYLLLVAFGVHGPIGGLLDRWFGLRVVFDYKGAALAAAVISFPLMVRSIRIAFTSIDARLEDAARTLGARPLDAFLTVSVPLARPGIIAGCVLSFARSMGEFGATIMIAGSIPGQTRTVPLYIFSLLSAPGGAEQAQAIVVVSILIALGALFCAEWLERRGTQVWSRAR